jgi:hypothetical protein
MAAITTAATGTESKIERSVAGRQSPATTFSSEAQCGAGRASPAIFVSGGYSLRRTNQLTVCLLAGLAWGAATSGRAAPASAEPTRENCEAAVEQAHALAAALPADDPSRYFAERDLHQAMVEAGNGEFDDCLEMAERATEEVREHRHVLRPGETLKVLRPDENPGR